MRHSSGFQQPIYGESSGQTRLSRGGRCAGCRGRSCPADEPHSVTESCWELSWPAAAVSCGSCLPDFTACLGLKQHGCIVCNVTSGVTKMPTRHPSHRTAGPRHIVLLAHTTSYCWPTPHRIAGPHHIVLLAHTTSYCWPTPHRIAGPRHIVLLGHVTSYCWPTPHRTAGPRHIVLLAHSTSHCWPTPHRIAGPRHITYCRPTSYDVLPAHVI